MATSPHTVTLRDLYARESARIRKAFDTTTDGMAAATQRAALVDQVALRLWQEYIGNGGASPNGFCLVARGGYGRGTLLPHSDIDLLFLSDNPGVLNRYKDTIGRICQQMWDLRLRVSPTARTLSGCSEFDPNNLELTLSLLDGRHLAGDRQLFRVFHDVTMAEVVHRNWPALVEALAELTRTRHAKYGNTVFHLEPNLKECPGGLRDSNVACWLSFLAAVEKQGKRSELPPMEAFVRQDHQPALAFLLSARCFLHYLHGRDDNTLSWEAQDAAAAKGIGVDGHPSDNAAEWMRNYFRHARPISRWTNQLLDEVSAARSSLYRQFLNWRSRVSNADFSVVDGRVYLQQSTSVRDPEVLLRMFEFIARHGLKLATETETRIEQVLPSLSFPTGAALWSHLRDVLLAPHAARALRDMHALGVLDTLIPEYRLIDSLVIRDFYHRYTVDEHSFAAIEGLHQLKKPGCADWEAPYAGIFAELEQPDLLLLAVLLHDVGKGLPQGTHVDASLQAAESAFARLALGEPQRDTVRFLIANHLEMSAALRRDIFDHDNVCAFARKVGSPERLKMLCLLSYADIRAVNPQALTPWKAENLWHLYMATANYLDRSADDASFQESLQQEYVAKVSALVPGREQPLRDFFAALPQRYLRAHSSEQIAMHFDLASRLNQQPVQLALSAARNLYDLTLVTRDRPALFATICGALTAWSMDIVKANAFTSHAGVVVDTFSFRDRFRTLEMNPPERERFERNVVEVLRGEVDIAHLIEGRMSAGQVTPVKVTVETRLTFDNDSSAHSTLLEVIAQDRPGLLYRIASTLARHGCNIEIALIDTEGQMAIDVFYVTRDGAKLDDATQDSWRTALDRELRTTLAEPRSDARTKRGR